MRWLIVLCFLLVFPVMSQQEDEGKSAPLLVFALDGNGHLYAPLQDIESLQTLDIDEDIFALFWAESTGRLAVVGAELTIFTAEDEPIIVEVEPVSVRGWSPDGRFLLMLMIIDEESALVAFDADTQQVVSLVEGIYLASTPTSVGWSPDGSSVLYDLDGFSLLAVSTQCLSDPALNCENTEFRFPREIDEYGQPEEFGVPMMSPDGEQLAFMCGDELCIGDVNTLTVADHLPLRLGVGLNYVPLWVDQHLYYIDSQTVYAYHIGDEEEALLFEFDTDVTDPFLGTITEAGLLLIGVTIGR